MQPISFKSDRLLGMPPRKVFVLQTQAFLNFRAFRLVLKHQHHALDFPGDPPRDATQFTPVLPSKREPSFIFPGLSHTARRPRRFNAQ